MKVIEEIPKTMDILNLHGIGDLRFEKKETYKLEKDSVLVIPICQNCYLKKENCGREIKFNSDLYRVY